MTGNAADAGDLLARRRSFRIPSREATRTSVRIGALALAAGVVTGAQLEQARAVQKANGGRLGAALVSLGYLTEEQVADLVAKSYGLPVVNDLDTLDVRPEVLVLVDREHCLSHCVLPLSRQGAQLQMAMADPTNVFAADAIQFKTGLRIRPVVANAATSDGRQNGALTDRPSAGTPTAPC